MKKLDYSLSNEDCERAVDEFICNCYKSPIELVTADIQSSISKQLDNDIYQAVVATGVIVDKDELIRALKYDRDQYEKGYSDGYHEGMIALANIIRDKLKDKKFVVQRMYADAIFGLSYEQVYNLLSEYIKEKKKMKNDNFKEGLIEAIKVAGQMIIDNAEDIAGKTEHMSYLDISVNFDPENGSIPELTINRSHLPPYKKVEAILKAFNGEGEKIDEQKKWRYAKLG